MAPGDVLTDFSAAIKAIAAGRRAAVSVHQVLYGMPMDLPDHVVAPDTPVQNVHHVDRVPVRLRQIMPLADSAKCARGEECEKGYTPEMAQTEADRCLQCGLICYLHEKDAPVPQTAVSA